MLRILQGDALEQLPRLPAQSVQCCVTSPPYWGLRDYGTAQWDGGEDGCEHSNYRETPRSTLQGGRATQEQATVFRDCPKCGARRIDSQLGLESTPEDYIANMVRVFREVKRVLRDDGTLWVNMGDSYASSGGNGDAKSGLYKCAEKSDGIPRSPAASLRDDMHGLKRPNTAKNGLKPKDLCGIPWRLAFALQADGWYLRSDIIWHKPNPMPESVTDRPTKAHEYIFLLTKAERYFYDAEAIRENGVVPEGTRRTLMPERALAMGRNPSGNEANGFVNVSGYRNKRSVWTIPTQPYAEAHFATFPEEIPKLAILAGSKPGDTVLDPFAGSGTVGQVALELGRRAILIELNPEYVRLIEDRTRVTPGMF